MAELEHRKNDSAMPRSGLLTLPILGAITFVVFALGLVVTNGAKLPAMLQVLSEGSTSCLILSVHDGDTIRCGIEPVRLADIEAPELPGSTKCAGFREAREWCDYELAEQSRDALVDFLATGKVELVRRGEDRYGRTLAIVRVNGVSAGEHLVQRGLARPWE